MCGIIGYTGKKQAVPFLRKGLKKLEYRGYDSVGIAVQGERILLAKRCGQVEGLLPFLSDFSGTCGIGHTRWATHGRANEVNAHPHRVGDYILVHNGILENYRELKEELQAKGISFQSETDTEAIAALFSLYGQDGLLSAAERVLPRLKGAYAIAVLHEGETGRILAAAKGSPLLIGRAEHGYFLSSDLPTLACFSPVAASVSDGSFALLSADGAEFFDGRGKISPPSFVRHGVSPQTTEKGNYSSYMEKEICEIPFAVGRTVEGMRKQAFPFEEKLLSADRLVFVACGTALNSCRIASFLAEKLLRIPCECVSAGEFRDRDPVLTSRTAVFAVSQSGETADTLFCAEKIKSLGCLLIGVTNVAESALARMAEYTLVTCADREIGVAATKSYMAQLACFYTLFYRLSGSSLLSLREIPVRERETLESVKEAAKRVARLAVLSDGVFFIGRGLDGAVATEAALKMKEITYRFSEGYAAGELKHGTLALVDEDSLIVAFATQPELFDKMENAVAQVSARGGKVVLIASDEAFAGEEFCRKYGVRERILLSVGGELAPFVSVLPAQLIALRAAELLSLDPDKPRNLAKSVTVE